MIDKALASCIEEGIGIQIGTRNERLEPNGVHVLAVRVEDDGTRLVAFVPDICIGQVMPDLESNGQAALVFARPPDERACQVKGIFEGTVVPSESDRRFVLDQWDRWLERLASIGLPRVCFEHWPTWPCTGVRLRATALFNQTPGPNTGGAL